MKVSGLAVALALSAFGATSAFSATTNLSVAPGGLFGTVGYKTAYGIANRDPTSAQRYAIGGFRLVDDSDVEFVAWCLDVIEDLTLPSEYTITKTPFSDNLPDSLLSATQRGNVQKLFDMNYSDTLIGSSVLSAAFQLALWEIIYEGAANALHVATGDWFANSNSAAAIANANAFLDGLLGPSVDKRFNLTFYEQSGGQNLVSALPVPVPAAGGMFVLALAGLYGASRRKRGSN